MRGSAGTWLLLSLSLSVVAGSAAGRRDAGVLQSDGEVLVPLRVDAAGRPLHVPHAPRVRRHAHTDPPADLDINLPDGGSPDPPTDPRTVHYHLTSARHGDFHLQLSPHDELFSDSFRILHRKWRRRRDVTDDVTDGVTKWERVTVEREVSAHCVYTGHSRHHPGSTVAVSLCGDGALTGVIQTASATLLLEPHPTNTSSLPPGAGRPHVLYQYQGHQAGSVGRNATTCPAAGDDSSINKAFEFYDDVSEAANGHHQRSRRDAPNTAPDRPRVVETLVVVDHAMVAAHGEQNVTTYVLTLLNMVSKLFHDHSIGSTKINISLVALILLEGDEPGLVVTPRADSALTNFCHWQSGLEGVHHDHAILLTGVDLCAHDDSLCDTLGFAPIEGMCKRYRSCTVNEDTGLGTAFTVTHEAGHNLGMLHDGEGNLCAADHGGSIMAPALYGAPSGVFQWSVCSRTYLTKFLQSPQSWCLADRSPASQELRFPDKLPGELYDADVQCKWQFGNKATLCPYDFAADLCKSLWCFVGGRKCETKFLPAAEGTSCGPGKWCRVGVCVAYATAGPAPVPGGWSRWSEWSACSRSCGGGVASSRRRCNRPRPQYGGAGCEGDATRWRMCNMEKCPAGSMDFRAEQCTEHDNRAFRGHYYTWKPYTSTPEEDRCRLYCKADRYEFYFALSNQVIDGTRCSDQSEDDVCVQGTCYRVGCDGVVASSVTLDNCGVCGGDNSTCRVIAGTIDRDMPLNAYFAVLSVPAGARSLMVREARLSPSYLALRSARPGGQYYLNGGWRVAWPGRYLFGGLAVEYTRPYDGPETLTADGPTREQLIIEVLVQGERPVIEYSYTLPRQVDRDVMSPPTPPPPPRHNYTWSVATSACSATCGSGRSVVTARCLRDLEAEVAGSLCPADARPQSGVRECSSQPCPPRWVPSAWSPCSSSCGGGLQRRRVRCMQHVNSTTEVKVKKQLCEDQKRPRRKQQCNRQECLPEWHVGLWSQCSSAACGESGVRRRVVRCRSPPRRRLPDAMCTASQGAKPRAREACQAPRGCQEPAPPRYRWFLSAWSQCSVTCGAGTRSRDLQCSGRDGAGGGWVAVAADHCSRLARPRVGLLEPCHQVACGGGGAPRWFISPWGKCSLTCGVGGVQSRLVTCLDEETGAAGGSCDQRSQPAARRRCSGLRECPKLSPSEEEAACTDTFPWCRLVPAHDLCQHEFYGQRCCRACAAAAAAAADDDDGDDDIRTD